MRVALLLMRTSPSSTSVHSMSFICAVDVSNHSARSLARYSRPGSIARSSFPDVSFIVVHLLHGIAKCTATVLD
jgi:hypothetical protein